MVSKVEVTATSPEAQKVARLREKSERFLNWFLAQAVVLEKENWESLGEDARQEPAVYLLGLTHKDYLDAIALWAAIKDPEILLKTVVMKEGFTGFFRRIRNALANTMTQTIHLSRSGASVGEMQEIGGGNKVPTVKGIYSQGTRNLMAPLKPGFSLLAREKEIVYPFINLSDSAPVFASGSGLWKNVREFIKRTGKNRVASREFLYLMSPLSVAQLDLLAENLDRKTKAGRAKMLENLEVLRAVHLAKMFVAVNELDLAPINPLLLNEANLVLFASAGKILREKGVALQKLINNNLLSKEDVKLAWSLLS